MYGAINLSIAGIRERLAIGLLHYRVGLADRSDVLRHCYPITIRELHAGWIVGDERVVTMLSGSYGWPGETVAARLRLYEADGSARPVLELAPAERHPVTVPEGGVAILERLGPR